jgi:Ni/Co efflux regulator RcnB
MKLRWWVAVCAAVLIATFNCPTAHAQDRDDHEHEKHERERHEHHWDEHHPQFDDHEHAAVREWYGRHRDREVVGFREEDRLPRDWEPRLQAGFVFDRDWRRRCYPVPPELLVELPPPPRHYRYYAIGGRVVLVDRGWRVADVLDVRF